MKMKMNIDDDDDGGDDEIDDGGRMTGLQNGNASAPV